MDFKTWYQESNIDNPHPAGVDPRIIDVGVQTLVSKMADNNMNTVGLVILITKKYQPYNTNRAAGPIAGNLISIQDDRLKNYHASVPLVENDPSKFDFEFVVEGEDSGSLHLSHPPLLYDNTDRNLLDSVIVHELQHAIDWISGVKFHITNPRINMQKYLSTVHECRAFSAQLTRLLRTANNAQDIIAALTRQAQMVNVPGAGQYENPTPFRWESPILLKFAQKFLKVQLNEDVMHVQPEYNPNAIVNQILNQVQQLGRKFFFRNFLTK